MKTNWTKLLLTAVGMTLSAAAAYGQELNANIPFAFQTTNANLSAGKYEVRVIGKGALMIVQVANLDSGKSILASAYRGSEKPGNARLVFRCWDTRGCSLAEAYDGSGSAWHFTLPRPTSAEKERLAVVFLRRADAE
jgi:hypothetical protein